MLSTSPAAVALAEAPVHTEQTAEAGCPRGHQWQVHKFGGTCVSAAERIQRVAQLIVDASADSQQARCAPGPPCAQIHSQPSKPSVTAPQRWSQSTGTRLACLACPELNTASIRYASGTTEVITLRPYPSISNSVG